MITKLINSQKPIIMGILNLTPDSFSDGQKEASLDYFLKKAKKLIDDGCDILDIGGESTRPDAEFVSLKEEKKRVLPFLKEFRTDYPDFPISLDTKKYELAKEAMPYGIQVINDVSFLSDERLLALAKEHACYYVLMHSRGDSETMMSLTEYPEGVVKGIKKEIEDKLVTIKNRQFPLEHIILDIGFGFAKTPDQCLEIFESLSEWKQFQMKLLLGISRKRFLQKVTGKNEPAQRDQLSAEMAQKAYQSGFQLIRTHNVKLTKQVLNG